MISKFYRLISFRCQKAEEDAMKPPHRALARSKSTDRHAKVNNNATAADPFGQIVARPPGPSAVLTPLERFVNNGA